MNESLQTILTRLRLSGLAASLDVRLQEAAGHHLDHREFLELLLQDELLVRNQRQIERRIKAADSANSRPSMSSTSRSIPPSSGRSSSIWPRGDSSAKSGTCC